MIITERLLKKIASLTSLSDSNIHLLLACAHQHELSKGQCLLNEGEVCNYLYFVESGWLRTYMNQEGKDVNINFTLEGNFTGDIKSLKTKKSTPYIIEAGQRSIVTSFDKDELLLLYSQSKEIELLCRKILGTFLIESHEQVAFYKLHSPLERYTFLIKNKPQMIQRIPVSQLSSYIGVARETLSRIRKKKL